MVFESGACLAVSGSFGATTCIWHVRNQNCLFICDGDDDNAEVFVIWAERPFVVLRLAGLLLRLGLWAVL